MLQWCHSIARSLAILWCCLYSLHSLLWVFKSDLRMRYGLYENRLSKSTVNCEINLMIVISERIVLHLTEMKKIGLSLTWWRSACAKCKRRSNVGQTISVYKQFESVTETEADRVRHRLQQICRWNYQCKGTSDESGATIIISTAILINSHCTLHKLCLWIFENSIIMFDV